MLLKKIKPFSRVNLRRHYLKGIKQLKFEHIKKNIYYYALILISISYTIVLYPTIYGVDTFNYIWMAQALRNGALTSERTWLIHPTSYFGYYPFSHTPIGIPLFLAFLMSIIEFLSFGIYGLTEVILFYNIIIILVLYKSSRCLAKTLFEDEFGRFIFVSATLFSTHIFRETMMIVSTRIVIIIIMMLILNYNLKFLKNKKRKKNSIFIIFFLFIGALSHRLWMGIIIAIVFMFLTLVIRRYRNIQYFSVFLILPIAIFSFFLGIDLYGIDPRYELNEELNYLELAIFLLSSYGSSIGVISIFFPISLIGSLYQLTFNFKFFRNIDRNKQSLDYKINSVQPLNNTFSYYLLLFIIPLFLVLITTKYALNLYFPIIIIFSVQGLRYIKSIIYKISERIEKTFPIIILLIIIGYNFFRIEIYPNYNSINFFLIFFLIFPTLLFSFSFLISFISKKTHLNYIINNKNFSLKRVKDEIWKVSLMMSFLMFSIITCEITRISFIDSSLPSDNRYLTDEEMDTIEYLKKQEINGLIFVTNSYISDRIGAVGSLPTFSESSYLGKNLYYGFINPDQVHNKTKFSLSEINSFVFFNYTDNIPIINTRNSILTLNLTKLDDYYTLLSYEVQYIISLNITYESNEVKNSILINSIEQSNYISSNKPIFSTKNLLIWKLY